MPYTCHNCGREVTSKKDYHDEKGNLVCRSCQLTYLRIQRYGSLEKYKEHMMEQLKKTNLERFGVENAFQSEDNKRKIRETNIKKYGVPYATQNKSIKDKVKKTNIERYGFENASQSQKVKDKMKNTFITKYGVDNPQRNFEIREKTYRTNLERYGNICPLASEEVKEKYIPKWIEKYGTPYPLHSELIKEREMESRKKTYSLYRNNPETLKRRIQTVINNGYEYIGQYVRDDNETVVIYRCPSCNETFEWALADDSRNAYCLKCAHESCGSIAENELRNYIRDILNDQTISHNRNILGHKKELDIYVPQYNIAIEFDGIYWHSDVNNYDKYEICKSKNIRLIQIVEQEWSTNKNKIKSYLKSVFGIYDKRIQARKCTVKEISNSEYKEFLNENHLQGYSPAKIRLGLYYNEELVQVESFGKPRFDKKHDYELIRECSKLGYAIIGGKEKIFSHFIRVYAPKTIISYCEKNKFSGESYRRLGFKLDHESKPGYSYYSKSGRLSRIEAQKHKLVKVLDNFDKNISEKENMKNNGYYPIYDYGNYVFIWERGD